MAFKRGSTLPEKEHRHIDCARAPHCTASAIVREKTKTGMANLCMDHYLAHIEHMRVERWIAAGRPTIGQSIDKMKSAHRNRVPGEDDETFRRAGELVS